MNNSDLFATTDPRLQKLMRQYSDYFRQNNLNLQKFNLTQSSHPQMYNFGQPNDLLQNGDARRGSDLMYNTKKQIKSPSKTNININPARPVLVNTEQRIFQEVVNLLLQINEIKDSIQKEKDLTLQMQVQRDNLLNKGSSRVKGKRPTDFEMESIINKLKSKQGDDLKISVAQLQKITTENENMEKNINRLRIKSKGNLKQVLEEQKQKHRSLKRRLEEKNNQDNINFQRVIKQGSSPALLDQVTKLQNDIARLQIAVEEGSNIGSEIRKLSQENQRLKAKTIQLMNQDQRLSQQSPQEAEQRRKLEQYIRQEQRNKILFFQDLKKFKQEYNALREENEQLKARLKGSHSGSRVDGYGNQGGYPSQQKFGQYRDLMGQMSEMLR